MVVKTVNYKLGFKMLNVMFADEPTEIKGYDRLYFSLCNKEDNEINAPGFLKALRYCSIVDITLPKDKLLFSFNRTTRNLIYRAQESKEFSYEIVQTSESYKDFFELLNNFIKAKKMWYKPNMSKKDLEDIGNYFICLIRYNSIPVEAGLSNIEENGDIYTEFMPARRVFEKGYDEICSIASRYAYYKSMEYAREHNGKRFFFLLGNSIENPTPLAKFKMSFNGKIIPKYMYVKNYNPLLKAMTRLNVWPA